MQCLARIVPPCIAWIQSGASASIRSTPRAPDPHGRRSPSAVQLDHRPREVLRSPPAAARRAGCTDRRGTGCGSIVRDHHRVPVMHVGRLQKAQRVAPEVEELPSVNPRTRSCRPNPNAFSGLRARSRRARLRRLRHEAVHPPVLVAFPVQQRDVCQPRRVKDLGNGAVDRLIVSCVPVWISAGRSSSMRNWLNVMPNSGCQLEIR